MCHSDWPNVVSFPDPTPEQREPGRISCVLNCLLLTNLVLYHHETSSMAHPVFLCKFHFLQCDWLLEPLNEKQLGYRRNLLRLVVGTGDWSKPYSVCTLQEILLCGVDSILRLTVLSSRYETRKIPGTQSEAVPSQVPYWLQEAV